MATNNSSNNSYTNNADGFSLAGGTTPRTLTLTAGNVSLSAGGSNTYTMPAATDTLVGRASTDTLTNKTLTDPVINQFGTASGLGAAWSSWTPTVIGATGFSVSLSQYIVMGKNCIFVINYTGGTGNTTGFSFTLPVTPVNNASYVVDIIGIGTDNGTIRPAMIEIVGNTATAICYFLNPGPGGWTASGTRAMRVTGVYQV